MTTASGSRIAARTSDGRRIPEATLGRLSLYLRVLENLQNRALISSDELAALSGVNSAMLRRDLSWAGSVGTRGVGYDVAALEGRLSEVLGVGERRTVVIIGVGNLGHALAGYAGLPARGFQVVGLFDVDHVGEVVAGLEVRAIDELRAGPGEYRDSIGVIATPAHAAQAALDVLVEIGITGVLSFAPTTLQAPPGVDVRRVDLASELQILAFHERLKSASSTKGAS
ncbi:redox-sensing transcriptional repressor Rex [Cumulibacter manganitolerans]|uniref:redox-sensing transcriptional repressor Rex n=1 Tax=Cumulibacter manganitolerans TaxID=1884992 RepID=UPI0018864F42|nr:redox-sensing transcriptional repressor Rex [Cumulibacter manganitolerans]